MATVHKSLVLEELRRRGLDARAEWVDKAMPDDIDVRQNASLFDMLGIDVTALSDEPANPKGAAS